MSSDIPPAVSSKKLGRQYVERQYFDLVRFEGQIHEST
ncbi:hypothetical protein FrEUN1fDRAFT_7072 [Parafrankia sp. EUN1f]|nr:hypothetical protein FrEUN1fDRAFT_7072 [Parafrankia sp. EUN1f]